MAHAKETMPIHTKKYNANGADNIAVNLSRFFPNAYMANKIHAPAAKIISIACTVSLAIKEPSKRYICSANEIAALITKLKSNLLSRSLLTQRFLSSPRL